MICKFCKTDVPNGPYCLCCGWQQSKSSPPTLHDLYKIVYSQHISKLTPKGQAGYQLAWKYISHLEASPFPALTINDYQSCIDRHANLSKSSQQKIQQLISQLCKRAILLGLCTTNIAPYLELPGRGSVACDPFSYEEIQRLQNCANNSSHPWRETAMIILILIFSGWRPEELFSIKKIAVNLQQFFFVSGSKTDAGSNRIVPIATSIRPYVLYFYFDKKKSDYLISTTNGCRINLTNWRVRKFYPCLQELGINQPDAPHRVKPYSARATFATMAYRAGVDRASLEKMIGHTDYYFTAQRYIRHNIKDFHCEMDKIVTHYYEESEGKCNDSWNCWE